MLIALLALLGVNLIALVLFLAVALSRKRWVTRQPGSFPGKVRRLSGEIGGVRSKWRRGYGRWVGEILVWTKGPFFFWNVLVAVDRSEGERAGESGEVTRLGDDVVVTRLRSGDLTIEVASRGADRGVLVGPFGESHGGAIVPSAEQPGERRRVMRRVPR